MIVAPSSMAALHVGLFVVRVLSPVFVVLATLSLVFTRPTPATLSTSPITSVVVATRVPRRSLILFLLSVAALTYFLDGATFVLSAVVYKYWPRHTGIDFNAVSGVVAFFGLAALGTWKEIHGIQVWTLKRISSGLAASLLLDIAQILLVGLSIRASGRFPPIGVPEDQRGLPIVPLLHFAFPCIRVLVLLPLLVALLSPRVVYIPAQGGEAVDAPQPVASTLLLPSPGTQVQASTGLSPLSASTAENTKYGTFRSSRTTTSHASDSTSRTTTPVPANAEKPAITPDPTWGEMWRRFRRISPYLWPSKSPRLQFLAALCIILLLISRAVNAFMPFTLGAVVSILEQGSSRSLWPYVGLYVGLRFLQSPGGINALRNSLWFPVMQYSDREMSLLSFDHILNLSFSFHTHRKTGEILRILDRGAVINHTLEIIMFSVVPTLIDITVALVIFAFTFGWLLSLIIFCVMALYVWASIYLTSWRTQIRRKMNDHDVVTRGIHADCLLNYETIKYFGGEQHESQRYQDAIHEYQKFEYQVELSLSLLNVVQNFIISTGLLLSSMVVALRVTNGKGTASEFVIFITYLNQLYGPLASLGWTYRSINQSLVDTEKLLNLLNEPSEVNDKPNAPDLVVDHGEIEFRNVSFSYDGRNKALNGISFKVPKGSSVALVGESGAGKSTILRLLYRFYDLKVGDGHILIDGRDITEVTQSSLRKAIGVVPQDPVLFNASISYNVGYGKFGSSPEEIEQAAKAAQMHERITTFPDGYETKVGERGIRLSGGEKQRVAIARTLLKNPPILLLDEATSALDTSTEKDIQKALQNLIKGRSSLSIAHRLSTIASADVILVLKDGEIIEQGSHRELIAQGGVFASMWADQISASDELAISIGEGSSTKEASGYVVDQARADPPVQTEAEAETAPGILEGGLVATPEMALEELPPQDTGVDATGAGANVARVSPSAEVQPEGSTPAESPATPTQAPGVSFPRELSTPERSGTPDPESETKRKILSSQNFQRLARKMSLTTRRPGSTSSIPIISGFLRDSSPRGSVEGEGEVGASDSPSSSLPGDSDKTRTKRDKKERKRKSIL